MTKNVLVTGGLGFIGRHLTTYLAARDHNVLVVDAMDRGAVRAGRDDGRAIDVARVDILDEAALGDLFEAFRPAQVYHLAARHFIPYCNAHPHETVRINIEGTQAVADACLQHGVKNVLFASSAAVYAPSMQAHKEIDAAGPTDIYGVSKLAGEQIMEILARRAGARVRSARLFNVIGPGETNPHLVPEIVRQLHAGGRSPLRLGNLSSQRDYVDVSDVVEACFLIMNMGDMPYDVFNVGTGRSYSAADIIGIFEGELQRDIRVETEPARLRIGDRPFLCADMSKTYDELRWRPRTSACETIRTMLARET